jgi:hypothetical protein
MLLRRCLDFSRRHLLTLQNEQAKFMEKVVRLLRQLHGGTSQQPFRLLVVAYSMGGLVVGRALDRLRDTAGLGEGAPHRVSWACVLAVAGHELCLAASYHPLVKIACRSV